MAIQTDRFKVQTPASGGDYYIPGEWPEDEYLSWIAIENCYLLTAPVAGDTTANSERTRTEFRECSADGDEVNFLVSQSHTHRMTMDLLKVCSNGRVVLGQIHVKNNDKPPLKLYYDNGKIKVGFRTTYNQTDDVKSTLYSGFNLGDKIAYSIINSGNGTVKIYLAVNAVNVYAAGMTSGPAWTATFDSSWDGKYLYSKGGIYNQLDAELSTGPDDMSQAKMYKLEIV